MLTDLDSGETLYAVSGGPRNLPAQDHKLQIFFPTTRKLDDADGDHDEFGFESLRPKRPCPHLITKRAVPAKRKSGVVTRAASKPRGVVMDGFEFLSDNIIRYTVDVMRTKTLVEAMAQMQDRTIRAVSYKGTFFATTTTTTTRSRKQLSDAGYKMKCVLYFLFPKEFARAGLVPNKNYCEKKMRVLV
jgi:hypothetical protein